MCPTGALLKFAASALLPNIQSTSTHVDFLYLQAQQAAVSDMRFNPRDANGFRQAKEQLGS